MKPRSILKIVAIILAVVFVLDVWGMTFQDANFQLYQLLGTFDGVVLGFYAYVFWKTRKRGW